MFLLPVCLLLGITGAILLARGAIGRRIGDHIACAGCGFDLSGLSDAQAACPECGMTLTDPDNTRIGTRRRAPALVWSGIGLLLLSAIGGWSLSSPGIARTPTWLLDLQTRLGGGARIAPVVDELRLRLAAGLVDPARARRLLDLAFEIQRDTGRQWDPAWGRFIEGAYAANIATADEAIAYVRDGYTFEPEMASQYPAYKMWPVLVRSRPVRGGSEVPPFVHWDLTRAAATLDGSPLRQFQDPFPGTPAIGPWPAQAEYWLDAGAGVHSARVLLDYKGTVKGAAQGISGSIDRTISLTVSKPRVERVKDPALASKIRPLVTIGLSPSPTGVPGAISGVVRITGPAPIPLSFTIYLRSGQTAWRAGSVYVPQGGEIAQPFEVHPEGLSSGQVDVILRHDESSWIPQESEPDRVWDGQIVIPDVPIKKPG